MKVVAAQATDPGKPASQADELARLRDRHSVGRFSASAAKIFVDGVLEARTAAMLAPYQGRDERGILNWEDSTVLADLVTRLDRHGLQVHMHAIGDRAVRSGLEAHGRGDRLRKGARVGYALPIATTPGRAYLETRQTWLV